VQVVFTSKARKGLRKMPAADRARLVEKLTAFAETGSGDVKALTGSPFLRLRHGQWRALFEIDGDLIVVRVAHRREVYD